MVELTPVTAVVRQTPVRVNTRHNPWSVPRLRGRGEQGYIVMHTKLLSALYVRTYASSRPRARHNGESALSLALAYHGLASEARSTGGARPRCFTSFRAVYENVRTDPQRRNPKPGERFGMRGYRSEYRMPFLCNRCCGPNLRPRPIIDGQFLLFCTPEPRTNPR
jgi:hypothetical protein